MIKVLILENYIPLLSSNINRIELNVNHNVNLLISVNGAGKTSVMKELNPLPPDNANYKPGGRKYVELVLDQKVYCLDSYTGKGNGHSFKVDGKELNSGGTLTVQKELVVQHFRLDLNLNKVLSGLKVPDLLSAMPISRRKDIFMQMYPSDTDYALGVWNRLKEERNSIKGAIKNQIARYTEENRKLETLNQYTIEELEKQVRNIEDTLKEAFLLRGSLEGAKCSPELQTNIAKFNRLVEKLTLDIAVTGGDTMEEILRQAQRYEDLLTFSEKQAAHYMTVIDENSRLLSGLSVSEHDPDKFKSQLAIIHDELKEIDVKLKQYRQILSQYPIFRDNELHEGLLAIRQEMTGYLHRITLASDPDVTSGTYKKWLEEFEYQSNKIKTLKSELNDYVHKLRHYDNVSELECPDCHTHFKPGVTKDDVEFARNAVTTLTGRIENEEAALAKLKRKIDNDAEWYYSMNQLLSFVRENGHLPVLITLIREYNVGKSPTETLLNALRTHCEYVMLLKRRSGLSEEENLLQGRINLLESNNMGQALAHIKWAEEQLYSANSGIRLYRSRLAECQKQQESLTRHDLDMDALAFLMDEIYRGMVDEGRFGLRQQVDDIINTLGPRKDRYLSDIIRTRSLSSVVQSIDEDIHRLKHRQLIIETLMDGLCPNKGLIGNLMTDFIQAVCANMNAIIREVWTDPLFVKPCNKENGDLTYKFPVINGDDSINPDIVDCSAGEADIINFAFRLTMLRYHNSDYPLLMDENGVFFDEIKRSRFFHYIKNLTLSGDCSQLFMVSHYVNQYGIFDKPNIIALKHEGLTINGDVNLHSLIN
mgnify:CR=1 FL=1